MDRIIVSEEIISWAAMNTRKGLHGKIAMFDWMLSWKYIIVGSMIVKSWILEVYFNYTNKIVGSVGMSHEIKIESTMWEGSHNGEI